MPLTPPKDIPLAANSALQPLPSIAPQTPQTLVSAMPTGVSAAAAAGMRPSQNQNQSSHATTAHATAMQALLSAAAQPLNSASFSLRPGQYHNQSRQATAVHAAAMRRLLNTAAQPASSPQAMQPQAASASLSQSGPLPLSSFGLAASSANPSSANPSSGNDATEVNIQHSLNVVRQQLHAVESNLRALEYGPQPHSAQYQSATAAMGFGLSAYTYPPLQPLYLNSLSAIPGRFPYSGVARGGLPGIGPLPTPQPAPETFQSAWQNLSPRTQALMLPPLLPPEQEQQLQRQLLSRELNQRIYLQRQSLLGLQLTGLELQQPAPIHLPYQQLFSQQQQLHGQEIKRLEQYEEDLQRQALTKIVMLKREKDDLRKQLELKTNEVKLLKELAVTAPSLAGAKPGESLGAASAANAANAANAASSSSSQKRQRITLQQFLHMPPAGASAEPGLLHHKKSTAKQSCSPWPTGNSKKSLLNSKTAAADFAGGAAAANLISGGAAAAADFTGPRGSASAAAADGLPAVQRGLAQAASLMHPRGHRAGLLNPESQANAAQEPRLTHEQAVASKITNPMLHGFQPIGTPHSRNTLPAAEAAATQPRAQNSAGFSSGSGTGFCTQSSASWLLRHPHPTKPVGSAGKATLVNDTAVLRLSMPSFNPNTSANTNLSQQAAASASSIPARSTSDPKTTTAPRPSIFASQKLTQPESYTRCSSQSSNSTSSSRARAELISRPIPASEATVLQQDAQLLLDSIGLANREVSAKAPSSRA